MGQTEREFFLDSVNETLIRMRDDNFIRIGGAPSVRIDFLNLECKCLVNESSFMANNVY